MKKFLVSILAVLYVASSLGATIDMQYCCGKLIHVALNLGNASNQFEAQHCSSQKKNVTKDCCKDVQQHFKVSHDQSTSADITVPSVYSFAANLPSPIGMPTIHFAPISEGNFSPHSPPVRETTPVYLKNCSFLI